MAASAAAAKKEKKFTKEEIIQVFREMHLIRRFEERMAQLYQQGKIGGFCHLYIGQEAVAVAAEHAVAKDDYMITSYRDHGHVLIRGADPEKVAAELVAKEGGIAKAKGGSMHLFDIEHNFYGGHGIVGGQIPVGAGMAFASKYRGDGRVTLCFFGEAAMNQGTFHESLNMASLWNLPIIFVCENNRYGMGTALERASAVKELSKRTAGAYHIEGVAADGMDFFAMHKCFAEAVERARMENRPTFIDAQTYRFRGHSMSDPVHSHYRTKEEVQDMQKRDPIKIVLQYIDDNQIASQSEIESLTEQINEEITESIARALNRPDPKAETIYDDVYVE